MILDMFNLSILVDVRIDVISKCTNLERNVIASTQLISRVRPLLSAKLLFLLFYSCCRCCCSCCFIVIFQCFDLYLDMLMPVDTRI